MTYLTVNITPWTDQLKGKNGGHNISMTVFLWIWTSMLQGNVYSLDKNEILHLFLSGPKETKENLQFRVVYHKLNIEINILVKR